jgi:protein-tyrosine-phosphatase
VTPQRDISTSTLAALKKDGVPVPNEKPRALTVEDVHRAAHVMAFCPVPSSLTNGHQVDSFDVPSPMDAYDESRDAILVHVRGLIDQLAREQRQK